MASQLTRVNGCYLKSYTGIRDERCRIGGSAWSVRFVLWWTKKKPGKSAYPCFVSRWHLAEPIFQFVRSMCRQHKCLFDAKCVFDALRLAHKITIKIHSSRRKKYIFADPRRHHSMAMLDVTSAQASCLAYISLGSNHKQENNQSISTAWTTVIISKAVYPGTCTQIIIEAIELELRTFRNVTQSARWCQRSRAQPTAAMVRANGSHFRRAVD